MKDTGIVRNVDPLGRITVPRELLNIRDIDLKSPVEIYTEGERIVIEKYRPDTWSADELKEALIAVCKEAGKEPLNYLRKLKKVDKPNEN